MSDLRREIPELTRGVSDEQLAKLEADARRRAKSPKERRQTATDEGYYNALILEEPAAAIVRVTEGKDEQAANCVLEGQRVRKTAGGPFAPPVTVAYISREDHDRYHREVAALVTKALERR